MLYVVTLIEGVWQTPVSLDEFERDNADDPEMLLDAHKQWARGTMARIGGGAGQFIMAALVRLPA